MKRVIVLAPHTDDGEFGCGGTMARLIEEGDEIWYVAFSDARRSLPADLSPDTLRKELFGAMGEFGIPRERTIIFDFEVRDFPARRQEILDEMVRLQKEIAPETVFLPSRHDTHQDHQTISLEGFRAFKSSTMLGYEAPWNNLSFETSGFFLLEERHIERKVAALRHYESQADRPYAREDFIRSLARTRGTQIGTDYAEAFEVIRFVS